MRVTIRLYKRYDIDLLSLYHNSEFKFKECFKSAVRNYIRGTPQKIKIPEPQDDTFSYETIQFQLNFHPKEDRDVIMWIRNIKAGYKNSILKNIFRNSLCGIYYYYTMNVHHADEMVTLNQKTAEISVHDDKSKNRQPVKEHKQDTIKNDEKKEQRTKEVNDEQRIEKIKETETLSTEEEHKEKISDLEVKTKITIPIPNEEDKKEIEKDEEIKETSQETENINILEKEESNETIDINDSFEEDENDSIFAIAGKMMQMQGL